jgi:hypothetical protein
MPAPLECAWLAAALLAANGHGQGLVRGTRPPFPTRRKAPLSRRRVSSDFTACTRAGDRGKRRQTAALQRGMPVNGIACRNTDIVRGPASQDINLRIGTLIAGRPCYGFSVGRAALLTFWPDAPRLGIFLAGTRRGGSSFDTPLSGVYNAADYRSCPVLFVRIRVTQEVSF